MKEGSARDRPREKLHQVGADGLGDAELLAVIIGHGTADEPALTVAGRVLGTVGGVHGLTRVGRDDLMQTPGIGAAVAARILAAVEIGRRTLMVSPAERPRFLNTREAALFLLPQYGAYPVERFGVALLDARYRLIRTRLLSSGARDRSLAHPREVFREAALAGASAIIAFHNHPSGDPTPSEEDVALTRRLVRAGELMGIDVIDHVILADTRFCSLKLAGAI